ncbi:MOSC domain-containing protein [Telluribacter humicola]|uniref:MOSC domain-containing protein n=1 Tax=Telluribacter humicola TaxID=1720261 RepID=UPI001A95662E|nr:MOSC N-terminal beta barrel domain-containing protein [Telluribacter humicola]
MQVGTIESLWRFPVKSFQGEQLDQVELDKNGVLGDRAYALVEKESGKVVTAKSVRQFPDLLMCKARFVSPPQPGQEIPPVEITLPNGTQLRSDLSEVDQVLSEYFGKAVTLARMAPEDYTIDQYHPDVEHLNPFGQRDTYVEQKLGWALFNEMGAPSPVSAGSFMDVFPASVMTTSTLSRLQELRPETRFDERRFRMNIIIKTTESGFIENDWLDKSITIQNNVRLMVTMPDPRCVMTTLAQEGLPKDTHVLKTLVDHNRLPIMGEGLYPCAGVYAIILKEGVVRVNDTVEIG